MAIESIAAAAIVKEVALTKAVEAAQQLAQKIGTESIEQARIAQSMEQMNSTNSFRTGEISSPEIDHRKAFEAKEEEATAELVGKMENPSWSEKQIFPENGDPVYCVEAGKDSCLLNGDLPNNGRIEVKNPIADNTMSVTSDEYGRNKVTEIDTIQKIDGIRDVYQQQRCRQLKDGINSDDAGHLLAREFGGPAEQINLQPMDSYTNRMGEWRNMEKSWGNTLDSGGKITDVKIESYYEDNSKRPTGFDVSYKENNVPTYRYIDNTPRNVDLLKTA